VRRLPPPERVQSPAVESSARTTRSTGTTRAATRARREPRVGSGELIAGASGVLLLLAMLLPWYGRETDIAGVVVAESWTAWQSLSVIAILLFAIGIAAIAVPVGRALWASPERFRHDRLIALLGLLGFVLVLFRLVDLPLAGIDVQAGDSIDSSRDAGIFLALLATAGIALGGRRAARG
jgi:hypothetical protein